MKVKLISRLFGVFLTLPAVSFFGMPASAAGALLPLKATGSVIAQTQNEMPVINVQGLDGRHWYKSGAGGRPPAGRAGPRRVNKGTGRRVTKRRPRGRSYRRRHGRRHYGGIWYNGPWIVGPGYYGGFYGGGYPGRYYDYGYEDDYYYEPPRRSSRVSRHQRWCLRRYRSYRLSTDTFRGYDGLNHRCRSPYRR